MKKKLICGLLSLIMLVTCCAMIGCESSGVPKYSKTDMVEFIDWDSCAEPSNNGIKLHSTREDVVFECKVDEGTLTLGEESGKELTAKPGDVIHWFPIKNEPLAYVEVLMKSGENIVGYSLVEIYYFSLTKDGGYSFIGYNSSAGCYQPILLESELDVANKQMSNVYVSEVVKKAKSYIPKSLTKKQVNQIKKSDNNDFNSLVNAVGEKIVSYGEYNGAVILFMSGYPLKTTSFKGIIISGIRFGLDDDWDMFVYKDNNVFNMEYQIEEVLEKGILTRRDIEIIGSMHGKYYAEQIKQRAEWDERYQ